MSEQTIFKMLRQRSKQPEHARHHGPGPCDQCALELARDNGSAIYHVALGSSKDGKIETSLIIAETRIARQDEVKALLAACYQHLQHCTDQNAEIIDELRQGEIKAAQEKEANEWKNRQPVPKAVNQGFVYLMINRANGFCKIGFSRKPKFREKTLASQEPKIEILTMKPGTMGDEIQMHEKYKEQRIRGEWFNLSEIQIEDIKWEWEGAQ